MSDAQYTAPHQCFKMNTVSLAGAPRPRLLSLTRRPGRPGEETKYDARGGRCSPASLGFYQIPRTSMPGPALHPQTKVRAGWLTEAMITRHAYEAQTASATDKSRGRRSRLKSPSGNDMKPVAGGVTDFTLMTQTVNYERLRTQESNVKS
ncbi:hypothetical protein BGZ61DRAFT_197996 [Ilyonectria robusta]|uniref:uncharacterized protein n=1 Tax=Ilyonectria robusta TaxID=1079257 RepID=UPI001E8E3319|nr:uncharacterized protein BGZ61DRAFT_197996 [Ilyonectria robusta]KAH8721992.1 hypothetical protein BGZ61DRAFT_197996 [Ilyonectria robusta]